MTKNILLTYFESVYTVEAFLNEVNLKLSSKDDEERLKKILKKLSHILIAFDFKLNGQFKSYIDKRYSFEQLLYLCFIKINESKSKFYDSHMLKSNNYKNVIKTMKNCINLPQNELEKKLFSIENLSMCYFLSNRQNKENKMMDCFYWRELFDLIGCSIIKYILIYSYIFRRITSSKNVYVQLSGPKFNSMHKTLVKEKLEHNEKIVIDKIISKMPKKPSVINQENIKVLKEENCQLLTYSEKKKASKLNTIFDAREEVLKKELIDANIVNAQLEKLGHQKMNKTSILYDRFLGHKISGKFIYSNFKIEPNEISANRIIDGFILNKIDFESYGKEKVQLMKSDLNKLIIEFMKRHRSCPFKVFLHCCCERDSKESNSSDKITKCASVKRKRDSENEEVVIINENNLKTNIKTKNVYCFLRRCLMYVLDYDEKKAKKEKFDKTCPLIGGRKNFEIVLKNVKSLISGLKFDTFTVNSLLHGIKFSRMSFLKAIDCHKHQRLVLLSLFRWLFEDYIFMLIRAYFYVTDTSKTNFDLFFYLKTDWKQIVNEQLSEKNYRKVYNLEKIKESDVIGYCSRYESNGMYMGRLLPKNVNNECRIISGCRAYNPCNKKTFNINYRFITLNICLKWLINQDPSLIGMACNGYKEIHRKYSKFLSFNLFNRTNLNEDNNSVLIKKWSFLKFDLNKCFDSINIKDLINYVSMLFYRELGIDYVFTLIKFCKIQFDLDQKQLKAKYDYMALKHNHHDKGFLNGIMDYINILESYKFKKSDCTIFVPLSIHDRNINAKKLTDSLKKCLEHVVIKIHDELYERMNGILQGSICSRNLCDLYLGKY
jgi:hypothetical protein